MIMIFQKVFGKEKAPLKTKSWFQKGGGGEKEMTSAAKATL